MITPKRYRKKPIEIEAMQMTGSTGDMLAVYQWVEKNTQGSFDPMADDLPGTGVSIDPATGFMLIATLEGIMQVKPGDWVIRGVAGEFHPCRDELFRQTYEDILPGTDPHILAVVPKSKYDDVVRLADIAEESRADLVGMLAEAVDELEPALRDVQAVRSLISAATAKGSDTVQVRNLRAALSKETS